MKKNFLISLSLIMSVLNVNGQNWSGTYQGDIFYNFGNVGIGTQTPYQQLSITGGIGFANENSQDKKLYSSADGVLEWFTNNGALQHGLAVSNQGDRMIFLNTLGNSYFIGGNLGIGTKTPYQQLSITGGIGFANENSQDKKLYSPADGVLEWFTNDGALQHAFAVSHQGEKKIYLSTSGNSYIVGGNLGIGTFSPVYKLDVIGTIRAREIKVDLNGADFVFEKNYKLMPLKDLEKFVKKNKHLPEIAPAKEMEENGTNLGNLNSKFLQKIEEMTLYIISQNESIEALKQMVKAQNEKIVKLEAAIK